jgi:hypothetical protein
MSMQGEHKKRKRRKAKCANLSINISLRLLCRFALFVLSWLKLNAIALKGTRKQDSCFNEVL